MSAASMTLPLHPADTELQITCPKCLIKKESGKKERENEKNSFLSF